MTLAASSLWRQMFSSLSNRNYRRYFSGQAVSLVGTWMQTVAQSWLVLQLTDSGTALGAGRRPADAAGAAARARTAGWSPTGSTSAN